MAADYQLSDIEDYFNEQRAQARWPFKRLDSTDWSYMNAWQKDGIPFAVICRGIAEVFEQQRRKAPHDKINTVRYCEGAIKRHWCDHIAAHIGSYNAEISTGHQSEFGQERIGEALQHWINALNDVVADTEPLQDAIWEAIERLKKLVLSDRLTELEFLDTSLAEIEAALTFALIAEAEAQERMPGYRAEAEKSLKEYRERMMPELFEQTIQNAINKKLRAEYDLPRLGLFYL